MLQKRKGSALVTTAVVCSMFVGLLAVNLAQIWKEDLASLEQARINAQAAVYCDDRIELLKGTIFQHLPTTAATGAIAGAYRERVEPLGNGQFKVAIFYGAEELPRATKVIERSALGKLNYDVTDTPGDKATDKAMSQRLADEEFADKAHYVAAAQDSAGNVLQVGNNKRPVYIRSDGKPEAVAFTFRGNRYGSISSGAKIPVVDNGAIDYIYLTDLLSTGIKEQNYSRKQGYVIFGNNMVFAYRNFYSAVAAGQFAQVKKPISFTTYQAMGTDTSRGNEKTTARIVWQAQKTTLQEDAFRLDTNGNTTVKEYFSVFWIGYKAE